MRQDRIRLMLKALSPVTHQRGSVGNESLVNTEQVQTPCGIVNVPVLSGNALRKMVRIHAAHDLGWSDLTKREVALLYGGGNERSKGGQPSLQIRGDIASTFPALALLGCSTADDIIPGAMSADRGILVCRENASRAQAMYPELQCDEWKSVGPASQFVGRWQYFRHDPLLSGVSGLHGESDYTGNSSMPFGGTCVIPGAIFLAEFRITFSTDVLAGCLLNAISMWQGSGGVLGGQGSRGHGRFACYVDSTANVESCVAAYVASREANRESCREIVRSIAS
jgi:hypothetical protein